MAFTKTYTDGIDWDNGEVIDEIRKDQEVENVSYLRDETQFRQILEIGPTIHPVDGRLYPVMRIGGPASGNPYKVYLSIDGTKLFEGAAFLGSALEESATDQDVSGLARGLRTLRIGISENGDVASEEEVFTSKFVLTQEHTKLSAWWKRSGNVLPPVGSGPQIRVEWMTVLLHREAMGW